MGNNPPATPEELRELHHMTHKEFNDAISDVADLLCRVTGDDAPTQIDIVGALASALIYDTKDHARALEVFMHTVKGHLDGLMMQHGSTARATWPQTH